MRYVSASLHGIPDRDSRGIRPTTAPSVRGNSRDIFEAFNSKTLEQEQYHHLLFRRIPVINQLPWEKNKTDVDGNSGPIGYAYHEA